MSEERRRHDGASVLHSEMAPVFTQGEAHNEPQKPINTRGLWSASVLVGGDHDDTGGSRRRPSIAAAALY